jgi:hypothetical protein
MAGRAALTEFEEIRPEPPEDVRTAVHEAARHTDPDNLALYKEAIRAMYPDAD